MLSEGSVKAHRLDTLNWGAGTLVTATMEAGQLRARRRRNWTQGTASAGLDSGHGFARSSGHEGEGVKCEVACWPTPPLFI